MSIILIESKWKINNSEFINDLKKLCPNEPNIEKANAFMKVTPLSIQIKKFIQYVLPHEKYITSEDDSYFLKNLNIFDYFGNDVINLFKSIWISKSINVTDKKNFWNYLKIYVALSTVYKRKI